MKIEQLLQVEDALHKADITIYVTAHTAIEPFHGYFNTRHWDRRKATMAMKRYEVAADILAMDMRNSPIQQLRKDTGRTPSGLKPCEGGCSYCDPDNNFMLYN